jgi:chloramphenicol-sensitive protein RarD
MSEIKNPDLGRGFLLGLGAYLIWGSFPLIISWLSFASPFEVVIWRVVFGFAVAAVLISVTRGWASVKAVLSQRRMLLWLVLASVMIYVNWQMYVVGILAGRVVETALGYFINPLVTIVLAVFFLGERLRLMQWVAIGLGTAAVAILTIDYGHVPWIAIVLALSFGIYGLAKNKLGGQVSAVNSFAFESGFLLPVAVIQGFILIASGTQLQFGTAGFWPTTGFIFFGVLTAVPLIMFGAAAKRLPLRVVGFLQYLTPVIQFCLGLFYFHEEMPPARWVGFVLVWLSLVILSSDALRQRSQNRAS